MTGSPNKLRVAAVQMNSQNSVSANLEQAREYSTEAVKRGVKVVVLPENFAFMGKRDADKLAVAEDLDGPIQQFCSELAKEHQVVIVAGSIPLTVPKQPNKVFASCMAWTHTGELQSRYDKIHLFDVKVATREGTQEYKESSHIEYGDCKIGYLDLATLGENERLGLSICYDVRFPELYRALSSAGCSAVCVPAAFTKDTGLAHWSTLLRARAIENQMFVIAANQCGVHPGGRETYGHSMIVDPWGTVLAERDEKPGIIVADLDFSARRKQCAQFPVLSHKRL